MKDCTDCKNALWKRTAAGKLHPSGDGRCQHEYKSPPLAGAFYWLGGVPAKALGGSINRRELLKEHCPYWSRK